MTDSAGRSTDQCALPVEQAWAAISHVFTLWQQRQVELQRRQVEAALQRLQVVTGAAVLPVVPIDEDEDALDEDDEAADVDAGDGAGAEVPPVDE